MPMDSVASAEVPGLPPAPCTQEARPSVGVCPWDAQDGAHTLPAPSTARCQQAHGCTCP